MLDAPIALVTGASGFIGQAVCSCLAKMGYRVYGIGRQQFSEVDFAKIRLSHWACCDIRVDALARLQVIPQIIVHCAGGGSVQAAINNPSAEFESTVQTTVEVLEFMRLFAPGAKLVVCSSAAVYGETQVSQIPVASYPQPLSIYGAHKQTMEILCRAYAQQLGIAISIVRLFSVFGIGNRKQLLWDACTKLTSGNGRFAGTGLETRDWLHVSDAAHLLILAANAASEAVPVYNGGRGIAIFAQTIVETLANTLLFDSDKVSFSGQARIGDPRHLVADIKESTELGWTASSRLIAEIQNYARWYTETHC